MSGDLGKRFGVAALAFLARLAYGAVQRTIRPVLGPDAAEIFAAFAADERVVIAFWHGQLSMMQAAYRGRGAGLCVQVSRHSDGEIIARAISRFGVRAARGSATRGGLASLRAMLEAHRQGYDLAIASDGPRGPRHQARVGAIRLAQATAARLFPVAAAPARGLVFRKSWDRFTVALPFTRVHYVVGRPLSIPRNAEETAVETARAGLEAELRRISAEAERRAAAGRRGRSMYALYDLVLAFGSFMALPVLRLARFRGHRERLGNYPSNLLERLRGRRVIWLHNASVGELTAARPLLVELRRRLPDFAILLSTTSLAGRDLARGIPDADGAVLLPLDVPSCIERALAAVEPRLFLFTETELWPNLLRALAGRGIPAMLVSGRVSPRAFRRYRWIRPFLRSVLANVAVFGMQSEAEAERIRALGAPRERVRVTGNLKFDAELVTAAPILDVEGPLWLAASTHAGEEAACVRVFKRLKQRAPDLRLLLAPRHLERLAEVERALRRERLPFVRRSELDGAWRGRPEVLLLDTLGELAGLYRYAAVAFVGGTLAAVGGHNVLEPARAGVPVLFGPHVEKVSDMAARLERIGGGRRVADEHELEAALGELLGDAAVRRRMAESARTAFAPSGAVAASADAAACLVA